MGVVLAALGTVVALWAMAAAALVGFVLFGLWSMSGAHDPSDTRPFQPTPATFIVEVDYETPPGHRRQMVLRLDPRDQDALGLGNWVLESTRLQQFEIPTTHVLTAYDEVHQHCLAAEAESFDHGNHAQGVIPAGTCLRSDEPLTIEIPG